MKQVKTDNAPAAIGPYSQAIISGGFLFSAGQIALDPESGQSMTARNKKLRFHMAIGDSVVPNTATERLVDAALVDRPTQFRSFIGTHGFLANPTELACYPGQDDMVDFLEGTK